MTTGGWRFGLAGGTGFAAGFGSPAARVVASISSPADVTHDRDGDGAINREGRSTDTPGVRTEDPATDGCPPCATVDPDRDKDGVPNEADTYPTRQAYPTPTRGRSQICPEAPPPPNPDRDKDGVLNEVDACPDTPGVPTQPKEDDLKAVIEHDIEITIMERVQFRTDSA